MTEGREVRMRAGTLLGVVALGLLGCGGGSPSAEDIVGGYRADLPGVATPGRRRRVRRSRSTRCAGAAGGSRWRENERAGPRRLPGGVALRSTMRRSLQ